MRAAGDLKPVEHHHRQAHVIQPTRHEIPERGARALDEHVRDRGLGGGRGRLLDLAPDWLSDNGKLAGGDAGEHPVHHRPRERVAVSEVLIRRNRQLVLIISGTDPRTMDLHAPTAQGHRAVLVTVTLRRAIRVPLAPRTDDLLDLPLHQLMHHAEPDTNTQREQSLLRRAHELAERLLDLRWKRTLSS